MADLGRFAEAQDQPRGGYAQALSEIRGGGKRGHWIWYVFPQLRGLGLSSHSQFYGIDGVEEAEAYLREPRLRARLQEIAGAAAAHLSAGVSIDRLMGSGVDAAKLVSSMTLFEAVAARLAADGGSDAVPLAALAATARQILDAAAAQGYTRCEHTVHVLRAAGV